MEKKSDQRLTKAERIADTHHIRRIRNRGALFSERALQVHRLPNRLDKPRLAIAVTRRAGGSVVRNQIRRKIREFFRKNKTVLGRFDYFFYLNRPLGSPTVHDWKIIFAKLLEWRETRSASTK